MAFAIYVSYLIDGAIAISELSLTFRDGRVPDFHTTSLHRSLQPRCELLSPDDRGYWRCDVFVPHSGFR